MNGEVAYTEPCQAKRAKTNGVARPLTATMAPAPHRPQAKTVSVRAAHIDETIPCRSADLGVRRNTPSDLINPCRQASDTVHETDSQLAKARNARFVPIPMRLRRAHIARSRPEATSALGSSTAAPSRGRMPTLPFVNRRTAVVRRTTVNPR